MSRIQGRFEALAKAKRKALIPYITAGDPSPQLAVPLLHALVEGGADIIELGVPFSDPMADGPVIQRSGERALKHGVGLKDVLGMVREFRGRDGATPLVLMGYANPIEAMGTRAFLAPRTPVPAAFANHFGVELLTGLLARGEPLGRLLQQLRGREAPLGLLYTAYCPPEIVPDACTEISTDTDTDA